MARHLSKLISIWTLCFVGNQLACNRLTNSKNELQLQCGLEARPDRTYVKILEADDTFEAILYANGVAKKAPQSSFGCIELAPGQDLESSLVIRSNSSHRAAFLNLDKRAAPGTLQQVMLSDAEDLQDHMLSIQCPSERVTAARQIFMKRNVQVSTRATFNVNRFTVTNKRQEIIQEGFLDSKATSIDLGNNLLEDQYFLRTESFDAFDLQGVPRVSECLVTLDYTSPSLKVSIADQELSLFKEPVVRLSPGQELKFTVMDSTASELFGCWRKRHSEAQQESCAESDFLPFNTFSAPDEGIWDLYFFATDALNQQSVRHHTTLMVFHQDRVDEVNVLAKLSRLSSAALDQLAAWTAMLDASRVLGRLTLTLERDNVRWDFISGFWELNKVLSARWRKDLGFSEADIKTSPNSRYWLAQGFREKILVFEGETFKRQIDDNFYEFEIRGEDSIWTYGYSSREGNILRSYQGTELRHTWKSLNGQLYASQSGRTAAIAGDTLTQVYDLANSGRPAHELKLPRGEIFFLKGDRYLIHKTNQNLTRIDLQNNYEKLVYELPKDCSIHGLSTRKDEELYIIGRKGPNLDSPPTALSEAPCGIKRIDFDAAAGARAVDIAADNGQFQADQLAFSTEDEQRYLMFGNRWSSKVYFYDLLFPSAEPMPVDLERGEVFTSIKSISTSKPRFLLETTKSRYIFDFTDNDPFFGKVNSGSLDDVCSPLPAHELIICASKDHNQVITYETKLDGKLGRESRLRQKDYEIPYVVSRSANARLRGNVADKQLRYFIEGKAEKVLELPDNSRILAISDGGNFAAVVSDKRNVSLFSWEGFIAKTEIDGPGEIIQLQISDQGMVYLLSAVNGSKTFEIWQHRGQVLERIGQSHKGLNQFLDTLILSPKGDYAVVYGGLTKMDPLINRPFGLFDSSSRFIRELEGNNSQLNFTRDGKGIYLIRGRNVNYYSIDSDQEESVARDLAFEPYEIEEGKILIGTTLYKSYNIKTGELIGDGGNTAIIQDNYIAMLTATSGDIKVYSPDGKRLILSYKPNEPMNELVPFKIIGHPGTPYFQVQFMTTNLENTHIVLRSFVTDSDLAQGWLDQWPQPLLNR